MTIRKSSKFNIHKLITLTVVVLGVVGIGLTVFAAQQRTSTESEAACSKSPTLTHIGSDGGKSSVTYKLRIKNNCSGYQRYAFKVAKAPNDKNWRWKFYGKNREGDWNTIWVRAGLQGQATVYLTVKRPSSIKPGRYYPIVAQAANHTKPWLRDSLSLSYVVE